MCQQFIASLDDLQRESQQISADSIECTVYSAATDQQEKIDLPDETIEELLRLCEFSLSDENSTQSIDSIVMDMKQFDYANIKQDPSEPSRDIFQVNPSRDLLSQCVYETISDSEIA